MLFIRTILKKMSTTFNVAKCRHSPYARMKEIGDEIGDKTYSAMLDCEECLAENLAEKEEEEEEEDDE